MSDPVELRILTGALRAICEEMGAVLIRSAHSANITERRDASTALFDADGMMVMQAEHIPVHLGAMPFAIDALVAQMRQPLQRRADLRAQLAATELAVRRIGELADRTGRARVASGFAEILDYAEERTRACLRALPDGERAARDVLEAREGDLEIVVRATVDGDRVR